MKRENMDVFKVLVVEDMPDENNAYCEMLREFGYTVESVRWAEDAKRLLSNTKDIDIALVDMKLEADKSGIELVKYLQSNHPWVVCVIMTSFPDLNDAALSMRAGACGYILKGESPPDLWREVLKEAGFRRASLTTLQEVRTSLIELGKQLAQTRGDINKLDRLLVTREEEIHRMQSRVKRVIGE